MASRNSAKPDTSSQVTIRIRRFEPGDVDAIDRLNRRFEERGILDRVYPESATTPALARGDAMSQELYVASDEAEVRGGVWLHEHEFYQQGQPFRAGWLKYPVGESLINREFGGVPGAMLLTTMRRQPEIMALGMGQRTAPFTQLLASLGWGIVDVPFYATAIRPSRLLRYLPQVRKSAPLRIAAAILSWTGLANLAMAPLSIRRRAALKPLLEGVQVHEEKQFGAWADEIWNRAQSRYGFVARRDAEMLNLFYRNFPHVTRLRVTRNGADIGWVCTTMADPRTEAGHSEFGGLCVGLIADGFGLPEDAPTLLAAAIQHLTNKHADLIVTNQIHSAWTAPLRSFGFLSRPTNFFFGYSKKIAARLNAAIAAGDVLLNRGDCDGPPKWA
jgi:hypothetical protein